MFSSEVVWEQPSHPDLVQVIKSNEPFGSYAISLVSLPAGIIFTPITNHHFVKERTYLTVENSPSSNIYLNSDLAYVNHSCAPSLEFDMALMETRVSRHHPLNKGDLLTFFYPSTEFTMTQPFDCRCGAQECLKSICGAKDLHAKELERYWLNQHILEQLRQKEEEGKMADSEAFMGGRGIKT